MPDKLIIAKIGGKVIDEAEKLSVILKDFADIPDFKILVHGGGKKASKLMKQLNIPVKMINGRRITDASSLEIVQMVYAGLINKNIVAELQANHCAAIGLSGADGDTILSHKRPPAEVDFGFVGDIDSINTEVIIKILKNGFIPVFCALTHDGKGQMLNTNADTVAAELGRALSSHYEVDIIYCFEMQGVMQDINDPNSVITYINQEKYAELKAENIISDGMIPKIDNAFAALDKGVQNVFIKHYSAITQKESGTRITK
ncbi:MAG: acetylglutamate kinase [Calditrichaceae bacterium]|nr:acetylglutamate kinase [Calditrichaceae bacterium]HES59113.1 acetylglutamate kinase [Caldithrix sp.]